MILSFFSGSCVSSASSWSVGGRPSSFSSFWLACFHRAMSSTMYAGTWIGCTALISAPLDGLA